MSNTDDLVKTGERLKQLRIEKEVSLDDVSKVTGITKSLLSKYERGIVDPGLRQITKLVRYFDVSLDWLLGFTDDKRPIVSYNQQPLDGLSDEGKKEALKFIRFLKDDSSKK